MTVRVEHRVAAETVAESVTIDLIEGAASAHRSIAEEAKRMTRSRVLRYLRSNLEQNGGGEHWAEYGADCEYDEARALAGEIVARMFPEVS